LAVDKRAFWNILSRKIIHVLYFRIWESGVVGKNDALAWPGRETTFMVRTRLGADEILTPRDAHVGSAEPANISSGKETVLVVDDEPLICNLVSYVLRGEGYHVLQAANGVDALSMTSEHTEKPIDLLVTDVLMPRMDGVELAGQLRAKWPDLRILFISSDFLDPQKVLAFGGRFLAKPFTLSALTIMVHEILHRV
jgi:two-component system, cell cycle sensor histidine kinase and response regulator CckA